MRRIDELHLEHPFAWGAQHSGQYEWQGLLTGQPLRWAPLEISQVWEVYLHGYDKVSEVRQALAHYFDFYNHRRSHSTLDGITPDAAYFKQPPLTAAA